jgi:hypothetical protein
VGRVAIQLEGQRRPALDLGIMGLDSDLDEVVRRMTKVSSGADELGLIATRRRHGAVNVYIVINIGCKGQVKVFFDSSDVRKKSAKASACSTGTSTGGVRPQPAIVDM